MPLLTPILFALVIAPALKDALHTSSAYEAYVATGTIGLLIPLNTMFAGLSVLVDRETGAQRELLAAPVPRPLLVLGNLIVAFGVTALQIGVLIGVARARGIHFDVDGLGVLWFLGAGALFTVGMYGAAESLAARVPRAEEYISRVPAIAIVPWFLAGSLFPITALPTFLTWFARFLPLTHALALVRYGLLNDSERPAQHLADGQRHRDGRAQHAGGRRVRGGAHGGRDPALRPEPRWGDPAAQASDWGVNSASRRSIVSSVPITMSTSPGSVTVSPGGWGTSSPLARRSAATIAGPATSVEPAAGAGGSRARRRSPPSDTRAPRRRRPPPAGGAQGAPSPSRSTCRGTRPARRLPGAASARPPRRSLWRPRSGRAGARARSG